MASESPDISAFSAITFRLEHLNTVVIRSCLSLNQRYELKANHNTDNPILTPSSVVYH
jgi:hypothetical protein